MRTAEQSPALPSPARPSPRAPGRAAGARAELLAWTLAGLVLAVLLAVARRPTGLWWRNLWDASHVLVSLALAAVTVRLSRRLRPVLARDSWLHFGTGLAAVLVLGGGLELAQFVVPGDPTLLDLVQDLMGGIAGLLFAAAWRDASGAGRRPGIRVLLLGAAAAALAVGLWHALSRSYLNVLRYRALPGIADFEHPWQRDYVRAIGGARLTMQPPPKGFLASGGRLVGRVELPANRMPGLDVSDLPGDWSPFASLAFDVWSPETSPVQLELSIHDDGPSRSREDHFNSAVSIRPGENRVALPMEFVRSGASNRPMRLKRIDSLVLYVARPSRPLTLYFDNIRLLGLAGAPVADGR